MYHAKSTLSIEKDNLGLNIRLVPETINLISEEQLLQTDDPRRFANTLWGLQELRWVMAGRSLTYDFKKQTTEIDRLLEMGVDIFPERFGPTKTTEILRSGCYVDPYLVSRGVLPQPDLPSEFIPVVGFAGLPQSGKGACGEIARQEYGSMHFAFIEGLFAFGFAMGLRPDKMTRAQLRGQVNDVIKPVFGFDVFAETAIKRGYRIALRNNLPMITCDGFRSVPEGKLVKRDGVVPNGHLIAVDSHFWLRYLRARKKPQESQRPKSILQFMWDNYVEYTTMIGPVLRMSEARIKNNSGYEDLRVRVRETIEPIFNDRGSI